MNQNSIICAIDTIEINQAVKLANEVTPYVVMIKLGLEFFYRNGISGVEEIKKCGLPIFLDLKLHDIPNTVAGALKAVEPLGLDIITIHTLAGGGVLKKAVETINSLKKTPLLAGVTILTSIDDISEIGINLAIRDEILKLTELAINSGLNAVVCSPQEIKPIRKNFGSKIKIITPGIRLSNAIMDDQKRVMTPKQAIAEGADYLVIGRPITSAPSPAKAAKKIFESLGF